MKKVYLTIISILMLGILLNGCKEDNGTEPKPVKGTIKGTVSFSGDWPAAPTEIRLVASKNFPLESADDLIIGALIPADADTHEYIFSLNPATYRMVGVAWKDMDSDWDQSRICGIYYSYDDSLNPGSVVLESGSAVAENININVHREDAHKVSGATIEGKIYIDGAWPDSITNAVVVVSKKDIIVEPFSLADLYFSDAISHGTGEFDYSIPVAASSYRTVCIIFYQTDHYLSLENIIYSQNIGGLVYAEIIAADNQTVEGPDMTIGFGPITSGIKGRVILKGKWPAEAEEVRIIAATTFPPEIDKLIIGDQIPVDAESYDYTFKLRPATYKAIGVVWRSVGTNFDLLSICGAYFAGTDSLAPSEVVVPDANTIVEPISILVNKSKARKITDTKIIGKIVFNGNWPSNFVEARVVATTKFNIFPTILPTILDFGFSSPISPGIDSYDYIVNAFPGTFVATGVVFFNETRTLTVNDVFYSSEVGALDLTPYTVVEDQHYDGPTFNVKF